MKIPYNLVAALPVEIRHDYMRIAVSRISKRLEAKPISDTDSLTIACYGPSLADTWQNIKPPIITVSGALRYLTERGIVPEYHTDCDPRQHKVKHFCPPVDGVRYLMASCCHPDAWDALQGQDVTLWHAYSADSTADWVRENDPRGILIRPGSTVGMAAIHVGGLLGYRHFEIHGMDSCLRPDGTRHAGPHYGKAQGGYTWQAGNYKYLTSKIMSNAAAEVINTLHNYPIFCVFHGTGLQQALVDEENLPNAALDGSEKAERVRNARAVIFPKETLNGLGIHV